MTAQVRVLGNQTRERVGNRARLDLNIGLLPDILP
jgi:hypothetical protein